jgi:CRP-like cAMP-binding protein
MRGLRDRRSVKRMRGEDPDAFYYMLRRYTELRLTVPEILASVPLISKLSTHERRLLTEHLAWRSYGKDSTIVLEGEPSDSMIIIMKGTARVVRGPDRIEVLQFKSGSFFGENALTVGGTVRHASVETNGPTLCVEITRDAYELCLKASSDASASGEIVQNSIQKAAEEAAIANEGQVPNYLRPQSVRVRRHQEAIRQARAPQERDRPENIGFSRTASGDVFSRAASTSSIPEDKDVSQLLPRTSSEGDLLQCDIRVATLESNAGKGYEVRTPRPPREKSSSAAPRPGHAYNPRLPLQLMGSSAAEADGDDGFTRTASCPAPKTGLQRQNSLSIVGPNFRPLLSHRENRDFMGLRQNARLQRIYAKSISGLTSPLSPSSQNVGLEVRNSAGTRSNDCWGLVNTALQNMDDPESQAAAITRQSAADAFGIRRLHSASGRLPSYSFTSNGTPGGSLVHPPPNRRSSVHEIITQTASPMPAAQPELPSRSRSSHNLSGHFVTPFRRISSAGPQRTTSSDSSSNMVQLPRVRKTPFVIDLVDLRG